MQLTIQGFLITSYLWLAILSTTNALGAANCLGVNKAYLVRTLQNMCANGKWYNPSSYANVRTTCAAKASDFVYKYGCLVTGSPTSRARRAIAESDSRLEGMSEADWSNALSKIRHNPERLDMASLIAREPPYDSIKTTDDLIALNPQAFQGYQLEHSGELGISNSVIKERASSTVCCNIAKLMVNGGVAALPMALGSGDEDQFKAGMLTVGIGWAAASACQRWFNVICNRRSSF